MPAYTRNNGKNTGDKWTEKGSQFLLRQGKDDGDKPVQHDVVQVGTKDDIFTNSNWKPGPLTEHGRDGAPQHDSYTTKQVEPLSRTSKGQRKTLGQAGKDQWEE